MKAVCLLIAGMLQGCTTAPSKEIRLIRAAERGDAPQVLELIRQGANINATDSDGWTPYLAASVNAQWQVMRILEIAGAETDPGF